MAISELDRKRIDAWCLKRTPAEHTDQMRVEARFRGNSVDILDCRAPWPADSSREWSDMRIAKLSFDPKSRDWTLFATNRDDRLLPYSEHFNDVGPTLPELLAELEDDPAFIFWG